MSRNIFIVVINLALMFSIASCEKDTIAPEESTDVAVVEGILYAGKKVEINLSTMIPFSEEEVYSIPIDSSTVYINYNSIDYLLSPVLGQAGKYESNDPNLKIETGSTYRLTFNYKETDVSSITTVPEKPINPSLSMSTVYIDPDVLTQSNNVTVAWENPESSYHLIVTEYLETSYSPINENLSEDRFEQFRKSSSSPILGEGFDLDFRRRLVFFGTYRIIIYNINEDYVNLYENIGQSTLNLTEPLTNIENGLGIFTGVNSDTLILEVSEI